MKRFDAECGLFGRKAANLYFVKLAGLSAEGGGLGACGIVVMSEGLYYMCSFFCINFVCR